MSKAWAGRTMSTGLPHDDSCSTTHSTWEHQTTGQANTLGTTAHRQGRRQRNGPSVVQNRASSMTNRTMTSWRHGELMRPARPSAVRLIERTRLGRQNGSTGNGRANGSSTDDS